MAVEVKVGIGVFVVVAPGVEVGFVVDVRLGIGEGICDGVSLATIEAVGAEVEVADSIGRVDVEMGIAVEVERVVAEGLITKVGEPGTTVDVAVLTVLAVGVDARLGSET